MDWATSRRGIAVVVALVAILVVESVAAPTAALGGMQPIGSQDTALTIDSTEPEPGETEPSPPAEATDPVELPELREVDSRTFQNADGTFTTEVHGGPIHYADEAGDLQPIDTEPVASRADGIALETKAAATRTSLGESSADGTLLTVSNADYHVSVRPALPSQVDAIRAPADRPPEVEDNRVFYRDVYPEVDLRYALFPHGVKEDIILKAPSAPTSFAYVLDAPGLKPVLIKDGSIELRDGDKSIFGIPAPFMVDSTPEEDGDGVRSTAVRYELSTVGDDTLLVISADEEWLADPKRVYPVYVDPTINDFTTQADTFISSAYPNNSFNAQWNPGEGGYYELWNGQWDSTSGVNYAFIKTGIPSNATVLDADFHVYVQHAASGSTATQLNIARLTSAFTTSQTWNMTHPSFSHLTHVNVGDNAWANYDVDATVQSWITGATTNYGFRISPGSSTLQSQWKRLRASENYPTNDPYLTVNWTRPGVTPTSPVSSAWGKGTFAWTYAANSGPAQSRIQLQVSTSSTTWSGTSLKINTGDIAHTAASYTASTSGLTSGTTYYWRVSVGNGTSWSGWSPAQTWKFDSTAPTFTSAYGAGAVTPADPAPTSTVDFYDLGNGSMSIKLRGADAHSGLKRFTLQLSNASDPMEVYHDWGVAGCVETNASTLVDPVSCTESFSSGTTREVTFTVVGLNLSTSFDVKYALSDVLGTRLPSGTTYTDTTRNLHFDATAPTGSISSPAASVIVGGTVNVIGTASDANFHQYTLEYGAGLSPSTWSPIGTNPRTSPVTNGTLGSWTTTSLADGDYTIRLRVYDKARISSGFTTVTRPVKVENGAPIAVIESPTDDRLFEGPLSIAGTASGDATFTDYTLHYAAGCSSPSSWTDIGTNPYPTPVTNGTLGSWDTAGLEGPHTLRLVANRNPGNPTTTTVCVQLGSSLGRQQQHHAETWDLGGGDELAVNVATGNAVVTHPLVSLPYRGGNALPLSLTYNSLVTDDVGLGAGWQLNLQRRLLLNPNGTVAFVDADGARHLFTTPVTEDDITSYARPASFYATLSKDANAPVEYTLTYRDGTVDRFDIAGATARLERSVDRHGNAIVLTYGTGDQIDQLSDPAGRDVDFSWDGSGRLTSIQDWAWIDANGVVQESATGSRRTYRFFHAAGGLTGWAEPLNTTGSCPTIDPDPYLTCLTYTDGRLAAVTKTQTVTTLNSGALGTASRKITTQIGYDDDRVATVTDAEQVAQSGPATTFTWDDADSVIVARPTTTTGYELVAAADPYARVRSVLRYLDPATPIERRTVWDSAFPIEPASVTVNYTAALSTPARTVSYLYQANSLGLVSRIVEPLTASTSRWTEHTYNVNNDVTETIVSQGGSGTLRTITRFCYDPDCTLSGSGLSQVAQVENYVAAGPRNNDTNVQTDYGHDTYGQRTSATRHNCTADSPCTHSGGIWSGGLDHRSDHFTFDANGNLTAEIVNYANGTVTGGDDLTPNATTQARTDVTTAHAYDTGGNRISTADPRRAILAATGSPAADDYVTRWTHDALNRRLGETSPTTPGLSAQSDTVSTFDELGAVRSATNAGGLVSATEFDRAGRATRAFEDPIGTPAPVVTAITTFDADGRPTAAQDRRQAADPSLGQTDTTYDGLGRAVLVTAAAGTTDESLTESGHDALDRRTSYVVGGQETTYAYDLGGRVTATDDGFACTTEAFDYRDLATSTTYGKDGDGCTGTGQYTVTHTRDGLGRLTRDENGSLRPVDDTFDAAGNRLRSAPVTDGLGGVMTITTVFVVNLLDQPVSETRTEGSTTRTSRTTYDSAGNPTDRCRWDGASAGDCPSGTNPPTALSTTTHDALNRRMSVTDGTTGQATVYDPAVNDQPTAVYTPVATGIELQTLYSYDSEHRLESLVTRQCTISSGHSCSATVALGSSTYDYDGNHNRVQVTESRDGTTPVARFYCYDARDQLVARNTGAGCDIGSDEAYTYDGAGNRLSATDAAGTRTFTYTADGQYTGATHDAAGRIVDLADWHMIEYDPEGRLVSLCDNVCSSGSLKLYFRYDADGRRTQITEHGGPQSTTTELRYVDGRISAEYTHTCDIYLGCTTPVLSRSYVTDEAGSVVKMVIPSGTNAGTYLVTWNGHGDALNLLRLDSGTVTLANSFSYDTWGTATVHTHNGIGDLGFRFRYVGQHGVQDDAVHGLPWLLMGARHYAPALGRFIQPDPSAQEENHYAYGTNNPISKIDPTGEFWCGPVTYVARFIPGFGWVWSAVCWGPALVGGLVSGAAWAGQQVGTALRNGTNFAKQQKKTAKATAKQRATDVPSWARGATRKPGETADQAARRIMNDRYGAGNWSPRTSREFSQIKKHLERGGR